MSFLRQSFLYISSGRLVLQLIDLTRTETAKRFFNLDNEIRFSNVILIHVKTKRVKHWKIVSNILASPNHLSIGFSWVTEYLSTSSMKTFLSNDLWPTKSDYNNCMYFQVVLTLAPSCSAISWNHEIHLGIITESNFSYVFNSR